MTRTCPRSFTAELEDRRLSGRDAPSDVDERPPDFRVAVSSQFIVEPESRLEWAGVQLEKAFLSGAQDLSLADEANDSSCSIWERLGGSTALLFSILWTCFLQPAQYV